MAQGDQPLQASGWDDEDGITLGELLAPALARWKTLAAVGLVTAPLAWGATFLLAERFESTAVFIPPQQAQGMGASGALASLGALAALSGAAVKSPIEQMVSLLQSRSVADRLIERFDLMRVYDAKLLVDARERLADRSRISAGKKDGLISVVVQDESAQRAADMANRYVEEFRVLNDTLILSEAKQRRVFFEKQLDEARAKLAEVQTALRDSGVDIGSIKAEPRAAAESYARIQAEVMAGEVRLRTLRESLADTSHEVRAQLATLAALRAQLADLERSAGAEPAGSADYIDRYRDFKYQEALFEQLAQQYELARIDESREGGQIQLVDVAQPAERKVFPRRTLIALAAALLVTLGLAGWWVVGGLRQRSRQALGRP